MTTTPKTQIRGHCQCCGREQAVVGARMSKHGYTVDNGWFQGVCSGNNFEPLQVRRDTTDKMIADVRRQAVGLDKYVVKLRAGTTFPETAHTGRYEKGHKVMGPFAEQAKHHQNSAVESAIWSAESRARSGRSWAADMEMLAEKIHGTKLRVVEVEPGPAPIPEGEKRVTRRGTLTVTRVTGGKVYWKDDRGFKSWTGVQAWRKFEMAKEGV